MNDTITDPLVSVILPVRNAGAYLQQCLESLFAQTYARFEVIAIDDFSVDDSFKLLKAYAKTEKRLKVFRNVKSYGTAITLNRALKRIKGEFIAFMKAEDISHPDRLKKQVMSLLSGKKTVAVGSQCYYINHKGKRIGKSSFPLASIQIYKKPLHGVSMQLEGVMVNKLLVPKDTLYFRPNAKHYTYSDIFVKLLRYGELINLPHYLYFHRKLTSEGHLVSPSQALDAAKQWIRSEALFGHSPSLRSFVFPILRLKPTIS